jgi:hypothetical protein
MSVILAQPGLEDPYRRTGRHFDLQLDVRPADGLDDIGRGGIQPPVAADQAGLHQLVSFEPQRLVQRVSGLRCRRRVEQEPQPGLGNHRRLAWHGGLPAATGTARRARRR